MGKLVLEREAARRDGRRRGAKTRWGRDVAPARRDRRVPGRRRGARGGVRGARARAAGEDRAPEGGVSPACSKPSRRRRKRRRSPKISGEPEREVAAEGAAALPGAATAPEAEAEAEADDDLEPRDAGDSPVSGASPGGSRPKPADAGETKGEGGGFNGVPNASRKDADPSLALYTRRGASTRASRALSRHVSRAERGEQRRGEKRQEDESRSRTRSARGSSRPRLPRTQHLPAPPRIRPRTFAPLCSAGSSS